MSLLGRVAEAIAKAEAEDDGVAVSEDNDWYQGLGERLAPAALAVVREAVEALKKSGRVGSASPSYYWAIDDVLALFNAPDVAVTQEQPATNLREPASLSTNAPLVTATSGAPDAESERREERCPMCHGLRDIAWPVPIDDGRSGFAHCVHHFHHHFQDLGAATKEDTSKT